jgi:hypothetical protein
VTTNSAFMELIQAHERSWGMEQYPGRPSLADMLSRPVVALWSGDDKSGKGRFTVTVHNQIEELDDICLGMIVAGKVTPSSNRRLARVFVKQKQVKVTGLRLVFADLKQK